MDIKELTKQIKENDEKYFALFTEEKQIIQELGKLAYYQSNLISKLWHAKEDSQKEQKEIQKEKAVHPALELSPLAEASDFKTVKNAVPKPDKPKRQRKRTN